VFERWAGFAMREVESTGMKTLDTVHCI
jgi:hypothetical protein